MYTKRSRVLMVDAAVSPIPLTPPPVTVDVAAQTSPSFTSAAPLLVDHSTSDQNLPTGIASRVTEIVSQLMQTSPKVIDLMCKLRPNSSKHQQTAIRNQLRDIYNSALDQDGIPQDLLPGLALVLARNTVAVVDTVTSATDFGMLFARTITAFVGLK